MVKKYRKKPVVIEALQFTGQNIEECLEFCQTAMRPASDLTPVYLLIPTLEGTHTCSLNDWIIKGISNEFYPCKPDIFEKTYDEIQSLAAAYEAKS